MAPPTESNPTRRDFLRGMAGTALAPAALAASSRVAASEADRPNVLLIFPDQWRRQAIGCYGDPVVRTPNIDRLASEGVRFDRCYATNPVCTPARAALLTGRYSHQTGMIRNDLLLPYDEVTLAERLRDSGYACEYIGKWHMNGEQRPGYVEKGEARQGFERFEGFNRGHWYPKGAQYFSDDGEHLKPDEFESFYQTDLAIDFMREHRRDPFFIMLAWGPPHTPYRPPEGYDRVTPGDLVWRENVPPEKRSDNKTPGQLCGYYGLCETLDDAMGRLLAHLDRSRLADNTLVLFASDHGDCHGSHGLHHKGHPEEESTGIPLIARLPGVIPEGAVSQTLASHIDLMPTVLSLCGVDTPRQVAGRNLAPAFRGRGMEQRPVYLEGRMTGLKPRKNPNGYGAWRAIVTERHKLAVDWEGKVRLLTDLREDPYELNNMADKPEVAGLQEELLGRLRRVGKQTGDPFPEAIEPAPTPKLEGQ